MDASVIKIVDSKDFQVLSNVGDTSFGLHDIDERIVEYIIKNKYEREKKTGRRFSDPHNVETVNAYASIIRGIKENVVENGSVNVDLANMNNGESGRVNKPFDEKNQLKINKDLIANQLCRDIYDWSLAHIDKAIKQADIDEREIDEIVLIGSPSKMPGFMEYLKTAYPNKTINFVQEDQLAVGAAIVGKKLKYQQIKVTEILCRSIGIGLYTGVITYLLFRNSPLPCVGGCVYSTLIDDQESMVLDVYEGERPHVKFCRYLGEVTIQNLPPGIAGKVKCELYLRMDGEGILEVNAVDLASGNPLETVIDANPDMLNDKNEANWNSVADFETDLDPIEAERYKKIDYNLIVQLEKLDDNLEYLIDHYRSHRHSKYIIDNLFDIKEKLYNQRRTITLEESKTIQKEIEDFIRQVEKKR
jgi:molecular chaperone DnaK (HSP70)